MRFLLTALLFGAALQAQTESPVVTAIRNNDLGMLKRDLKGAAAYQDGRKTTALMYAALTGSLASMQLLIEGGADVNAKNSFDATALMWCATDFDKVKLLVSKGAEVNAKSQQGRSALLIAAMSDGTSQIVKYLLDHGADVKNAGESPESTPLTAAAGAGDTATFRLLLERGASAPMPAGGIALMSAAASGNTDIMRTLLDRGIPADFSGPPTTGKVKNGDIQLGLFTSLSLAVSFGGPEAVKMLLDHKADVNHADVRGLTPLMLAVALDHPNPRTVRLLLEAGANRDLRSKSGETAVDWAKKFQNPEIMALLGLPVTKVAEPVFAAKPLPAKDALAKSTALLEKTASSFFVAGGCSSCHSHNLGSMAISAAKAAGAGVDMSGHSDHFKQTESTWKSQDQLLVQRFDPPGGTSMTGMVALEFATENAKPSLLTDALVQNIAMQQHPDGSWHDDGFARPPMGEGAVADTMLAIRAITSFGGAGRKPEFDARVARAAAWLTSHTPATTDDSTMQLLGLRYAGADAAKLRSLARRLIAQQHSDGGWAQTPFLASDAYATGQSLVALREAGIPLTDPARRKGIDFLLKTQQADGSWHVVSRSPKFQPYFQSGFPHDHDQWISMAGTCWAVTALAHSVEGSMRAGK